MKTIGLLGGMSWESTATYYKALNEGVKQSLGGFHSAKICMYSVDFHEIEKLQHQGDWHKLAEMLADAAKSVEAGGAEFLLICTNTMHKVADEIGSRISIPILHIADATAQRLKHDGRNRVGLLGTQFTMEQDFYKGRLSERHNIDVIVPNAAQQKIVHDVIYSELCLGKVIDESRDRYLEIIKDLYNNGAQAIILGCTEIAHLIHQEHTDVPLYDTAEAHIAEAVKFAVSQ